MPSKIRNTGTWHKNWKASEKKIQEWKTDQYGDHFVEKNQSFHVFYDVFCEFRQVKNNRRVNRDFLRSLNRNRDLIVHLIAVL